MATKSESLDQLLKRCGTGRYLAAVAAGLSPTTVRYWCEGSGRKPWGTSAFALARALGVEQTEVVAAIMESSRRSARKRRKQHQTADQSQ